MMFKELKKSDNKFAVKRAKDCVIFDSDRVVSICDYCYDEINNNFIFAVKVCKENGLYDIDYLFLDEDFQIIDALTEEEGVNPNFIYGSDKSIWVSLISTNSNKEIVLPLRDRHRIQKKIEKRDIGYSGYFLWDGETCGYESSIFGGKDKIAIYQFDKKGLYKGKKNIKLDFCSKGNVLVNNNDCYIYEIVFLGRKIVLKVFHIDKKGEILRSWSSQEIEEVHMCHLISVKEEEYTFVCSYEGKNSLDIISFGQSGVIKKKKLLIEVINITSFYCLDPCIVGKSGINTIHYTSGEGVGIIQFQENRVIRNVFSSNGEVYDKEEKLTDFSGNIYFNVLQEKDDYILISPINCLENTVKKWLMLKI